MNKNKSFKTKWGEVDVICPKCNQVTKRNRGLTRQNVKNLFKKPTMQDLMILAMVMLALFGAWAYNMENAKYQEMIRDPQELCEFYWQNIAHGNFDERYDYNLSGEITKKEYQTDEYGNLIDSVGRLDLGSRTIMDYNLSN